VSVYICVCVPFTSQIFSHVTGTNDNNLPFFDVLLTLHLSIFISVFNQLDAQNLFYNKFISCLYMFRAHVLIIRRSKLHYTASGIIKPIGDCLVQVLFHVSTCFEHVLEICRGMK